MKQKLTNAEIKALSDAELGRSIVDIIGDTYLDGFWYLNGGKYPHPSPHFTSLCRSLDAVAEVEKIVIEKVGKYEYGEALINRMGMSGSHLSGITSNGIAEIAMASSRERAEACLMALQGEI